MSDISNERLDAILAACEGVTPWSAAELREDSCAECARQGTAEYFISNIDGGYHATFGDKAQATFIANCDPDTIRSMAAEIKRLREKAP